MTDLERIAQLEKLLEAADQAVKKAKYSRNDAEVEDYVQYCYRTISKYFWEVVSEMETLPKEEDNLYYRGKGYRQNMENYLHAAHTYAEGGWVNAVLKGIRMQVSSTNEDRDSELLHQLEGLVGAADNEVYKYTHANNYEEHTEKEIEQYKRWVFSTIQRQFWDIAQKIKNQPTYSPEISHEGKMKSYLYAMNANKEGSWYTNTLKKLRLKA